MVKTGAAAEAAAEAAAASVLVSSFIFTFHFGFSFDLILLFVFFFADTGMKYNSVCGVATAVANTTSALQHIAQATIDNIQTHMAGETNHSARPLASRVVLCTSTQHT